jgi:hypothetical protein
MASYGKRDRILTALCLWCVLFLFSGCAASNQPVSDEYDRVNKTLIDLEHDYEAENMEAFMKKVGRDYILDYTALERSVSRELDDYTGFDIDLIVDMVSVDSDTGIIFAETHWTKRRVSMNTGKEFMIQSETTFIFRSLPDGTLVLRGMKGTPLFGGEW